MGEMSPPTAADYAYDAARTAQQHSQQLELRVAALEQQIRQLYELVKWLRDVPTRPAQRVIPRPDADRVDS